QARAEKEALARAGVDVRYQEVPGGKHEYAVWSHLPEGLAWLAEKPRERFPKRVAKALRNTSEPWAHWLRVDALDAEGGPKAGEMPTASVAAEVVVDGDAQTIRVTSEHVKALTVCV